MIRPVTMVTFLAFIGSGLYLYQVKHQAQLVDQEIRKVLDTTAAARTRAGVLRAEYALLNDPDRLTQLATAYLTDLKPTQPAQWSSMAEIDRRLPPVGGPTAEPTPLEPDAPTATEPKPMAQAEPPAARAEPAPAAPPVRSEPAVVARAEPVRPAPRPPVVAAAQPAPPPAVAAPKDTPPVVLAAKEPLRPAPAVAPKPRATVVAVRSAPLPPPGRVNPAHAQPIPLMPPPVQVAAAPLPPPRQVPSLLPRVSAPSGASVLAATQPVVREATYATPAEPARRADPLPPMVGSALGMARTMAATPVSSTTLEPQGKQR